MCLGGYGKALYALPFVPFKKIIKNWWEQESLFWQLRKHYHIHITPLSVTWYKDSARPKSGVLFATGTQRYCFISIQDIPVLWQCWNPTNRPPTGVKALVYLYFIFTSLRVRVTHTPRSWGYYIYTDAPILMLCKGPVSFKNMYTLRGLSLTGL